MVKVKDRYWELLLRLIFPEQKKWVASLLVVAGLSALTGPFWAPYANGVLEKYLDITVPLPDQEIGWALLCVGVVTVYLNVLLDRQPKAVPAPSKTPVPAASSQDIADRKTVEALLRTIRTPTFDRFFYYGRLSMIYMPILHFHAGLEGYIEKVSFHLNDAQLRDCALGLHASLSKALSYGSFFSKTANEKLLKFDSKHDIYRDHEAENAHQSILKAVDDTERYLSNLCTQIRTKYPDFDLDATDQAALSEYNAYQEKAFELKKPITSDLGLAVMNAILEVSDNKDYPNLQNLVAKLGLPRVDIQVALDDLIEREFVAHLYPGQLHQKYTLLKTGRAYYVANRE